MASCAASDDAYRVRRLETPRSNRRNPAALPILVHFMGRSHSAKLKNLSQGGAMIEASVRLFRGDEIDFKCGAIDVRARVAWHEGTNIGLQFCTPIPEKDFRDQVLRADFLAERRSTKLSIAH